MHTKSNGILMLSLGALYIFDTHPIKKPTLKYHIGLLRCRKIELQKNKTLLLTIPLMRIDDKINPKDYSIAPLPILGLTMSTLEDEDFVDDDNKAKNSKNSKKREKSKTNKKKEKKSSQKQIKNDNEKNNQDNETELNKEEDMPQVIIDIPDINDENNIENDQNNNKNTNESSQPENLHQADEKSKDNEKDLSQSSEPVQDNEKNKKSGTESDGLQSKNPKESKKGKNDKKKKDKNQKRKLTNEEDLEKNLLSETSFKNDDEDQINNENKEEEKNEEDQINKENKEEEKNDENQITKENEEEEKNDSENEEPVNFRELVEVSDQDFDNQNDDSDSSEDDKNNNNKSKSKQKLSKIKEIVIKIKSPSHSKFLFKAIYKIFLSALSNVTNSISPKFIPEIQKVKISKKSLTNRAILVSHYCFSRGELLDCADYFDDKWNGQPLFVIGPSFHPGGYGVSFGCSIGLETAIKAIIFKRAHFSYISAFLSSLLISTQSIKTIGFTEYPRDKEIKLKFINVKKTNVKSWILLNCCSSMIKSFAEATDGLPKPIQSLKIGRYSYNKNDANEVFNTITKKKNMKKMLQLSFVSLNFKEFPRTSFTKLCTSLANLEELEISRVNIDGSTIFQAVCSDARHIHQLVMNGLKFEKSWCMKEKMNLPEGLIFLDLSESYFTDTTLADLFQNITYKVSKLPFFFILRSIQFTETVFPAFESPEFDLKLCQPNILEFDMSGNSFPSKSFESIFHFIATQKRIRNLIFTDVFVDNQRYFVHMLSSVRGCDVLTGIDFSGNFHPVIVQQFISSVSTNQSLKRLSVKNSGALNKGFELIENLLNMVKGLREIEIDGFHPEEKVDLDKRHPLIICWDKIRKSKSILANDLPIKDLADLGFEIEKVYNDDDNNNNDVDVDVDDDIDDDESEKSNPDYVKLKINHNNNFCYKFDDRLSQADKKMFTQLVKPYRSSPSTIEERLGYLYLCIKKGDVEEIKRAISPEIFQILHKNLKPIENNENEEKENKENKNTKNKTDIESNNINNNNNNNKVNFDPNLLKNAINQQNDRSELVSTISTLSKTIKIDKKNIENKDDEYEGFEKVDDKNDDSDDLNIDILLSDKIDADFDDVNSSSDFDDFLKSNDENKDVVADIDDGDQIQITKTTSRTIKPPSLTEANDDDDDDDLKNLLDDETIKNDAAAAAVDDDTDDDFSDFLNQTQSHPQIYKTMNQSKDASDTILKFLEEESDSSFEVTKKGANALISKTLGRVTFTSDDETNNKRAKKTKTKATAKPNHKSSKNNKDSNEITKTKPKNKTNNRSGDSDSDSDSDFDSNQNSKKNDVDNNKGTYYRNKKKTRNILPVNNSDDDDEFGYLRNNQNTNKNKQSIQLESDSDDQNLKVLNNNNNNNKHKTRKDKVSSSIQNDDENENTNQKIKNKSNKVSEKRVKFSNQIQQESTHKFSLQNIDDDDEDEIEAEIQQNKKDSKQKKNAKSTSNKHQKF